MADITLSTLILFFLALPGFVARSVYHSDEFSRTILPRSWVEDFTSALVFALPLHFIAIFISEFIHHVSKEIYYPIVPDVDFAKIVRLLAANFEPTGPYSLNGIVDNAYQNWIYVLMYALLIHTLGGCLGFTTRTIVWKNKLDLKWPTLFKFRNYWLYRLRGRGIIEGNIDPNIQFIHALVEVEEKIVLYSGILQSFIVDEDGELLDLLIINANRSFNTMKKKDKNVDYEWLGIPGSIFVLKYSEIKNLNLFYYHLDPDGKLIKLEAQWIP